jgi:hypothetical protein
VCHKKEKTQYALQHHMIDDEVDTGSILDMGQRWVYKDRYQLRKIALRAIEKKQNFKQQLGI